MYNDDVVFNLLNMHCMTYLYNAIHNTPLNIMDTDYYGIKIISRQVIYSRNIVIYNLTSTHFHIFTSTMNLFKFWLLALQVGISGYNRYSNLICLVIRLLYNLRTVQYFNANVNSFFSKQESFFMLIVKRINFSIMQMFSLN